MVFDKKYKNRIILCTRVTTIYRILNKKYGHNFHHNKRNPIDELIFVILSTKTTEAVYLRVYNEVKRDFPTYVSINKAPATLIAKTIKRAGLSNQKATALKEAFKIITEEFGRLTLAPLKKMSDEECENFLLTLPGVGKKVARCIMMYSLEREVFPVDTHCWRVCCRLGWAQGFSPNVAPTVKDQDSLQEIIPKEYRFSLHVSMVSLGREICTAKSPKCTICPISKYCPKVGV